VSWAGVGARAAERRRPRDPADHIASLAPSACRVAARESRNPAWIRTQEVRRRTRSPPTPAVGSALPSAAASKMGAVSLSRSHPFASMTARGPVRSRRSRAGGSGVRRAAAGGSATPGSPRQSWSPRPGSMRPAPTAPVDVAYTLGCVPYHWPRPWPHCMGSSRTRCFRLSGPFDGSRLLLSALTRRCSAHSRAPMLGDRWSLRSGAATALTGGFSGPAT
jgi:hypothetical protein